MTVFLICEFDPFHFGHEYIIKKAKELYPGRPLVCIMSGNFVQRGRAACADMFSRAKCAVYGGADLVLSLPFPWCMSSAEHFAYGAMSVISGLYEKGDALVFGSECADKKRLSDAAEAVASEGFKNRLSEYIKQTKLPYAQCRAALYGDGEIFSSPNDILGIEYIKAKNSLCPGLEITAVKRSFGFRSSTDIKKSASPLEMIPEYAKNILSDADFPSDIKYAERIIINHLRTSPYKYAADGEHGLISRIVKAAQSAENLSKLAEKSSSPQFTNARIRRAALYSYFGIKSSYLKHMPCFTQLLAANISGLKYLSASKKTRRIEIITKPADKSKLSDNAKKQYELQCEADGLYCFCTKAVRDGTYFLKSTPYIDASAASGGAL